MVSAKVPRLGVGLAYQEPLRPFVEERRDHFDFVEVVPDILWTDRGRGKRQRYVDDESGVRFLRALRRDVPIVPHSIGLSIGSAHAFNRAHVGQIARWHECLAFPWHSDHLSFHLTPGRGHEINTGITLPLPHDEATIDLLSPRIAAIRRRLPIPFLLENNVYYFVLSGQELDEATFLNSLCRNTGCGLLLDLHNLYTNCRNHRASALGFLERLDLDNVIEIHVAGGMSHQGFYLDAHSGTVPPPVWRLLDWVLPRCPNVGGVVFELFGSWYGKVGEAGLIRQLARLRELWARHRGATERAA